MKTIEEITELQGFDYPEKLGKWGEWEIFALRMNNPNAFTGRPFYLMRKDNEIRFSTPQEAEDIFEALFHH